VIDLPEETFRKVLSALMAADRTLGIIRNAPGNTLNPHEISGNAYETHNQIRAILEELKEIHVSDIKIIAQTVEDSLDGNEGYVLLIVPFGVGVEGQYSTNVYTEDAIQALKAYIDKLVLAQQGEIPF
jgi:hypothetical protein